MKILGNKIRLKFTDSIARFTLYLSSIIFLTACQSTQLKKTDDIGYFHEVVLGSELGNTNKRIRKWTRDVNIFVTGESVSYLNAELHNIVNELNELIDTIDITIVDSANDANFIIYFGDGATYAKFEPNAASYIEDNWGIFWVYWNKRNEIYKGSMLVDIAQTRKVSASIAAQKHLLREELTQSLGMMNDSYQHKDSIFYQKFTYTTRYSALDEFIIKLLYNSTIKAGMNGAQVTEIYHNLKLPTSVLKHE